jgi:hypothetical protein
MINHDINFQNKNEEGKSISKEPDKTENKLLQIRLAKLQTEIQIQLVAALACVVLTGAFAVAFASARYDSDMVIFLPMAIIFATLTIIPACRAYLKTKELANSTRFQTGRK